MKSTTLVVLLALFITAGGAFAQNADHKADHKIDGALMTTLTEDADATAPFFVIFKERADLGAASRIPDRAARGRAVVQALQAAANRSQAGVRGYLQGRRVAFTSFWVQSAIHIPNGTLELARALAQRPEVAAVIPEGVYSVPSVINTQASIQSVEWNIGKIRADLVWPTTTGTGIVVANIDTGVRATHSALASSYSGRFYDPTGICPGGLPCDNDNHGTHTMGTMVGNNVAGNQIGVAPGATWMACKGCATNSCSGLHLIACAQWIADPGGTSNHPDVVNNSWGGGGGDSWFQTYVESWRALGIFPAFSAGNSGPGCGTVGSPGDYAASFASGATGSTDVIASFSSRGPSVFGGIKPNVTAPGVNVRSSIASSDTSYGFGSGTSMASPHTAGTVALIWAAKPGLRGAVAVTEDLLRDTALKLGTSETCGGTGGQIPNNVYGWGRIDAFDAAIGGATPNQPPLVTINSPGNGDSFNCGTTVVFNGSASDPEDGSLSSTIAWTSDGSSFGVGSSASRMYSCGESGTRTIVARVTDSQGVEDTDSINIIIVNTGLPAAPSGLTASVSGGAVTLNWNDNSDNEISFRVETKLKKGKTWTTAGTVGGNVTTFQHNPGPGNRQYRVAAQNANGSSPFSNVVSVNVGN